MRHSKQKSKHIILLFQVSQGLFMSFGAKVKALIIAYNSKKFPTLPSLPRLLLPSPMTLATLLFLLLLNAHFHFTTLYQSPPLPGLFSPEHFPPSNIWYDVLVYNIYNFFPYFSLPTLHSQHYQSRKSKTV